MRAFYLVLAITLALLVTDIQSEKVRKHKKYKPKPKVDEVKNEADDDIKMMEDDAKVADIQRENERAREAVESPPEVGGIDMDTNIRLIDPCVKVHCGAGRICEVDSKGEPQCVCIPNCPIETDSRRKVCSNHNETWTSDCAVYQQRCLCDKGDEKCKGETYKHVHIEYYGECRNMPDCSKDEMADFPRRMRDWLFNIMRDLAEREELTPHFLKMEREAESNMTKRWANAAVWKFCDLDGHPPDRSVSRHELFPIRAPLMSLEHCISPFLDKCDKDSNHRITIKEWAECLELEEDDLDDRCEELQDEDD